MKLIADSGSTKTDWAVVESDHQPVIHLQTQGINPFHQDETVVRHIIEEELKPSLGGGVEAVCFYGAGCTASATPRVAAVLAESFPGKVEIEVHSDLTGAARALCGRREGIACILGTGANSCLYDGAAVVANVPPLGYILGDEGSGAALGKLFMNAIFKGELPAEVRDHYLGETSQTYEGVIERVYRRPLANRYLATVALFISKHKAEYEGLSQLVKDNFRAFLHNNVSRYHRSDLPVNFVGSIASHFAGELRAVLDEEGYRPGIITQSPMEGLIAYHK